MIELSYIYEYIVLAETLNFSRAANICYITQPALSRHIAAIEEEMGGKLLERTTRSVKLTPAGRSVYTSFKDIWQEYDSAKEQTKVLSAGIHGMLRLSSPYYWTEDFTEPVIRQFRRELPLCDVMVTSCQPNEGLVNLSEERTDIAVYPYVPDVDSRIRRVPFADEKLCVICRKDNPVAKKESVRADELTDELFVFTGQFNSDYDQYNRLIRSLLNAHGVYVKNSQFTQQVEVLHISRAYLYHIYILKQLDIPDVHDLGNYRHACSFSRFEQELQPFALKSLEVIRGGTGLECSAAQEVRS